MSSANPPITDMIVHAANVAMGHYATSRRTASADAPKISPRDKS